MTDNEGLVYFDNFPPGPALLSVEFPNSRYQRRLTIPEDASEIRLTVPTGLVPVLVSNALTTRPVTSASVTWEGGGARIEARTIASGDALLEGTAASPGILTVEAIGYERFQAKLPEPPATVMEVPLMPDPPSNLQARIITAAGEPVPDAIVGATPQNPLDVPQIASADAKGVVTLFDLPPGGLQLSASADGFATEVVSVPDDERTGIVLMLSRGYRAIVSVELPSSDGPYLIRVIDEGGAAVEDHLDLTSARSMESSGRLSLGPLPPGRYVIELRSGHDNRRTPFEITDRDVFVTVR